MRITRIGTREVLYLELIEDSFHRDVPQINPSIMGNGQLASMTSLAPGGMSALVAMTFILSNTDQTDPEPVDDHVGSLTLPSDRA